ncbi:hypothetical protein [Pendulispora albinea]|uniref:Secreted protein n=1 Tax=Pendulispora albinea TaxID=2741071 RepID=A0ABZ2LY10_9BACT
MMRYVTAALLAVFVAVPACMSHDLNLGNNAALTGGDASTEPDAASTPVDGAPKYTREEVERARRICNDTPSGTSDNDLRSIEGLRQRLLGAWYRCSNTGFGRSIRFTLDGVAYGLIDDPLGGTGDGTAREDIATYSLTPPFGDDAGLGNFQVRVRWTTGNVETVVPIFETSPRRMKYAETWFVPLLKL